MRRLRHQLQLPHQRLRQPLSSVSRRHRHRGHVSVKQLALALALPHDVPAHVTERRRRGAEILGPRREVLQVKRQPVRLRQRVDVDVVVREQVRARERAHRGHRVVSTPVATACAGRSRRDER